MASTNFEDLIIRDTRANQPAAGVPGRIQFVTDEGVTERDNGSSWDDITDLDPTAIHTDGSAEINGLTEKASPVSADLLVIEDSEASNAKKKLQIGNLPASGGDGFAQSSTVRKTDGDITTSSQSFVDATSMSVTITTGARRCLVLVQAFGVTSTTGSSNCTTLDIDGSSVGGTYGLAMQRDQGSLCFTYLTDVLTAASHTFKLQHRGSNGANSTLYASSIAPCILTVLETNLTS
jgi:hypothetical protein